MKKPLILIVLAVSAVSILLAICFDYRPSVWGTFKNPGTEPMLKRFIAMKINQANAATNNLPPEIKNLFNYAQRGNWLALSNSYSELKERINYQDSLGYGVWHWHGYRGAVEDFISDAAEKVGWHWEPQQPPRLEDTSGIALREIYGALDGFVTGDEKYSTALGRDIIASIPRGSVYLGSSDPCQDIVSAMCRSQVDGDPFFTITQNGLGSGEYRGYLRGMYYRALDIPTDADAENCFRDYQADLLQRARNITVAPGHDEPFPIYDYRAYPGRLAKILFDKNPERESFVEEEIPIPWMYPLLEPHGLIFKLNRHPANMLSYEIVQRDHEYWTKYIQPMIADWVKDSTSVADIAAFNDKTYGRLDFSGFTGDPRFIRNARSQEIFSGLRSAMGGLYEWRANQTTNAADQGRMLREADFAFRQAWALGPCSPSAVFRYAIFLAAQSRFGDAVLVGDTAATLSVMKGADSTLYAEATEAIQGVAKSKSTTGRPLNPGIIRR